MASIAPSKILVFGGTGAIGRYITSSLLSAYPGPGQLTLFTSPSTLSAKSTLLDRWKAAGLSVIVGDMTSESDVRAAYANTGADTVISAVGRDVLGTQIELIRLAEESGTVAWFLPSEYGTDIEYGPQSAEEKPHQLKLKVRRYVRESVRRLKVTYVVTGPYFDMWVDTMPGMEAAGGFDVGKREAHLIDDGEGKIGFCTMSDVGKFVAATLKHPEQSFGKALKVQSFVVTPKEVLAEYEKQTEAKWTVSSTPLDELRKLERKAWDEGNPRATGVTLRRIWAEGGTLYEKNDNGLLGFGSGEDCKLDSLEAGVHAALKGGWKNREV